VENQTNFVFYNDKIQAKRIYALITSVLYYISNIQNRVVQYFYF